MEKQISFRKKIQIKNKYFSNLFQQIIEYRFSYILILPFTLLFVIFIVIPVIVAIYYSFTYFNILQPPKFIGWENYRKLFFEDDIFLIAIKNTFIFAVITGPISYLLSLMLAWFVNELSPKLRAFMTLLFYAPALAGIYGIWKSIFFSGDQYGFINSYLLKLSIIVEPIQFLVDGKWMKLVIIIIILWASLGVGFLAFIAGFQNVDRSLYEAGAVDGIKNRYQELWFITLPSMKGQLMFSAVMNITASFGIGDAITNIVGFPSSGYNAHTIMNHLSDYGGIRFEMGYACAIATILFLIMVGSNKIVQKLLAKVGE